MGRMCTYHASSDRWLVFALCSLGCTANGGGEVDEVVASKTAGLKAPAASQNRRAVREPFGLTHQEHAGLLE